MMAGLAMGSGDAAADATAPRLESETAELVAAAIDEEAARDEDEEAPLGEGAMDVGEDDEDGGDGILPLVADVADGGGAPHKSLRRLRRKGAKPKQKATPDAAGAAAEGGSPPEPAAPEPEPSAASEPSGASLLGWDADDDGEPDEEVQLEDYLARRERGEDVGPMPGLEVSLSSSSREDGDEAAVADEGATGAGSDAPVDSGAGSEALPSDDEHEHDADAQRDLIAVAERERIGKGFQPEIKPLSSVLARIQHRTAEAAQRKPKDAHAPTSPGAVGDGEGKENAQVNGLRFADFADMIIAVKPAMPTGAGVGGVGGKVGALVVEPAQGDGAAASMDEAKAEEEGEGEEKEGEEEEEEGEGEGEEEEGEEEKTEEPARIRNEIRLAPARVPAAEDSAGDPTEMSEDEASEMSGASPSSEEGKEEEEEEEEESSSSEDEDNGFTWERDEPLPEPLATTARAESKDGGAPAPAEGPLLGSQEKDKQRKKSKGRKGKGVSLPEVNAGFVEDEAELSEEEGHLHVDRYVPRVRTSARGRACVLRVCSHVLFNTTHASHPSSLNLTHPHPHSHSHPHPHSHSHSHAFACLRMPSHVFFSTPFIL